MRAAIVMVDSRTWLEAHRDDDGWRIELHRPRRVASVGYVDKPVVGAAQNLRIATSIAVGESAVDLETALALLASKGVTE